MKRFITYILILTLAVVLTGCGVSEEDYQKVSAEVDGLKKELEDLRAENTSLNEAIMEVYEERDRLVARISTLEDELKTAQNNEAATAEVKKEEPKFYVVEAGDTLGRVASKTKVSVEKIRELNNLRRDMLYVGEKLKLN